MALTYRERRRILQKVEENRIHRLWGNIKYELDMMELRERNRFFKGLMKKISEYKPKI